MEAREDVGDQVMISGGSGSDPDQRNQARLARELPFNSEVGLACDCSTEIASYSVILKNRDTVRGSRRFIQYK